MFNALNKNDIYSPTSTSYPQLIRVINYWFFSSVNFGNPNIFDDGENFENGKGKDIIQDRNRMNDDFETFITQALQSSPKTIEAMGGCQSNSSMTMEGQPSNLFVNGIHGRAFDKNVSNLQSEEYEKVYTPPGLYFGDFNYEGIDPQQHSDNMDNDKMNNNVWGF